MPALRPMTAEAFARLPDPPHGGKVELVRGEVVTSMPVGGPHSQCAALLVAALVPFVRSHRLGAVGVEAGFVLSREPDVVRAPDVHVVTAARLVEGKMPDGFFPGAPDLAVEVVSPDDTDTDVHDKVADYLAAGAGRVWVLRPAARTITVHRPGGDAHTFGPDDALGSDDAGFAVEGFVLAPSAVID